MNISLNVIYMELGVDYSCWKINYTNNSTKYSSATLQIFRNEYEQKLFPVSLIKYGYALQGKHLFYNICGDIQLFLGTGMSKLSFCSDLLHSRNHTVLCIIYLFSGINKISYFHHFTGKKLTWNFLLLYSWM